MSRIYRSILPVLREEKINKPTHHLQELLTIKSDDIQGRNKTQNLIIKRKKIPKPNVPECFKVLIRELQSLCLDINFHDSIKL